MKPTDMNAFTQLMMGLGVLYSKSIHAILIEFYWHAFVRYEYSAVKEAFQAHINHPDTGQYFPKPADIIRYLDGSTQSRALLAWTKVVQAIRNPGTNITVVFDDFLIHSVLQDMGGWLTLGLVKETELPYRAKEFNQRYGAYVLHPPTGYPKQLTGFFEHQNTQRGYTATSPCLLGDEAKALSVYQYGCHPYVNQRISAYLGVEQQSPILNHEE